MLKKLTPNRLRPLAISTASSVLTLAVLVMFERKMRSQDVVSESPQHDEEESEHSRIRCPLCDWQPKAFSRWLCGDCGDPEYFFNGCGMIWNTFDTHGLCPGCAHQWKWTSCLNCSQWSLHDDWYTKD